MTENKVEILTRTKGLLDNISPTGVKYIVEQFPSNNALWRIRSLNKTGPEILELSGHFTASARAQAVLTRYLNRQWDMSDEIAEKHKTKKEKYA